MVSTTSGAVTVTDQFPSDPAIAHSDLIDNSDRGDADASASSLIITNPGGDLDSFEISGNSFASASVSRTSPSGPGITASANATYTITFEVAAIELGIASFDLDYTLAQQDIDSTVSWGLVGPDPDVTDIGGIITAVG